MVGQSAEVVEPPILVGTGFTALDVLLGPNPRLAAGGTAANVPAALATLGWAATAAGTLGDDAAGRFVRSDLAAAGVDVSALALDPAWRTPVVLQEGSDGKDPVWRFVCPECGTRFAKHRPGSVDRANEILSSTPVPSVIFFDRASLFSLTLADGWRRLGALVVFEPSGLGRPKLFERATSLAHIIKYSAQRAPAIEDRLDEVPAALIRTEGPAGVSFRPAKRKSWYHAEAVRPGPITDASGAGDWTTAGILQRLFEDRQKARVVIAALSDAGVLDAAIERGQELGREACEWIGPRPGSSKTPAAVVPTGVYCPPVRAAVDD
jgi:fructokinase